MQWSLTLCLLSPFHYRSAIDSLVTALFFTGGINSKARLRQYDQYVEVDVKVDSDLNPRWQIHELPVDLSIDPKLRCRSEHVGRALPYSGVIGQRIYGVTTASLILHSLVVFVNDQPATCGTIVPYFLPSSSASIEFKLGVFGRVYIFQWPGECIIYAGTCTSMCTTALRIDIVVATCTVKNLE